MSTARIAVVIPFFRQGAYLEACLRSLLAQDLSEWEAVVVDDCSGDDVVARIAPAMGDARIRWIGHEQNRGLSAARNSGAAATTAPYLLALDADDLLEPAFLGKLLEALKRDPEADCAFCTLNLFGAETGQRFSRVEPLGRLAHSQWLPGPGVLMKRAFWQRIGGYNEAPEFRLGNEDWDFWLTAAEQGFRAVHHPEALYQYRMHATSMSHGLRARDYASRRILLERHRAFFEREGEPRNFMAEGFWRAARAAHHRGSLGWAVWLGGRALVLDRNWSRARDFASQLLPRWLSGLAHSGRRFFRGLPSNLHQAPVSPAHDPTTKKI